MNQDVTAREPLEVLQELQNIDADLYVMNDLRVKRPRELRNEEARVEAAEEFTQGIQDSIQQARLEADKSELDIQNCEAEIEKVQIAMNTARTNEEYQVYQDNIQRLKGRIGEFEEVVLEKMNAVEKLQEELGRAKVFVEEAQKDLAVKRSEVEEFVAEVDQRIATLEEKRQATISQVKGDTLEIYSRVLARYPDSPLAAVEGEVCQGCHMAVTKQLQSKLLMKQDLVQCLNCSRILHF